jgi:hypothetical protein
MISSKLGFPGGGVKAKVVLFGFVEDLSVLASYPSMIDASIACLYSAPCVSLLRYYFSSLG